MLSITDCAFSWPISVRACVSELFMLVGWGLCGLLRDSFCWEGEPLSLMWHERIDLMVGRRVGRGTYVGSSLERFARGFGLRCALCGRTLSRV